MRASVQEEPYSQEMNSASSGIESGAWSLDFMTWSANQYLSQPYIGEVSNGVVFFFLFFLHKNIVGAHQKHLKKGLLMSSHNICFCAENNKHINIILIEKKNP